LRGRGGGGGQAATVRSGAGTGSKQQRLAPPAAALHCMARLCGEPAGCGTVPIPGIGLAANSSRGSTLQCLQAGSWRQHWRQTAVCALRQLHSSKHDLKHARHCPSSRTAYRALTVKRSAWTLPLRLPTSHTGAGGVLAAASGADIAPGLPSAQLLGGAGRRGALLAPLLRPKDCQIFTVQRCSARIAQPALDLEATPGSPAGHFTFSAALF